MKNIIISTIFTFSLILSNQVVFSNPNDSIVYINELNFYSEFEKDCFSDVTQNKKIDYLKLYLSFNKTITSEGFLSYKSNFDKIISEIKPEIVKKKKTVKKIAFINFKADTMYFFIYHKFGVYKMFFVT